ncbi:MAG: CHAD domain-containing protein [Halieaceae bacterium]
MTSPLRRLNDEIDRHRQVLLEHYDEEGLHQLRVTIRRLRVFLKHFDGQDALDQRREWGRLMRFSNDARDWDTFINFARDALTTEHFEALHPALLRHQEAGRRLALEVLRSKDWEEHVTRWHVFLDQAPDFGAADFELALTAARRDVGSACSRACEKDNRKRWHKLRIAIKALRYLVDSSPDLQAQHGELISLCKQLQTDLGDWHDTVIHGKLLAQLVVSGDINNSLLPVAERLTTVQARRGAECLARVRATMSHRDISQAGTGFSKL